MSYVQSLYHIVIRTKASKQTLSLEKADELYSYIWGIVRNKGGVLFRVNGMQDHIHIFMSLHPTIALADFVRELKVETSKMLKRTVGFECFEAWGEGYAALSYSTRDKNLIVNYIKNQQEHHKKVSFREEYETFLREMGLELDERDWVR